MVTRQQYGTGTLWTSYDVSYTWQYTDEEEHREKGGEGRKKEIIREKGTKGMGQ